MAWMPKRRRAFSNPSSPPRSRARELDWGLPPFTASLSRAAAAFGWNRSRRKARASKSTSRESTRPRNLLHRRKLRSEEHTSELQSRLHLVCRLLLEKKKKCTRQPLQPTRRSASQKTQADEVIKIGVGAKLRHIAIIPRFSLHSAEFLAFVHQLLHHA